MKEWMNGLDGQQQLRIRFPKSNYPYETDLHYQGELIPLGIQAPHSEWGSPGQLWVAQCRAETGSEVSGWPRGTHCKWSEPLLSQLYARVSSPGKWPALKDCNSPSGEGLSVWTGDWKTQEPSEPQALLGIFCLFLSLKMRNRGQEESRSPDD